MPNPKRRHSKSRTRTRRAHDAIEPPQTVACDHCREPHMPHRMCPHCGYYKGRLIKEIEEQG